MKARSTKTSKEIKYITKACKITDFTFKQALKELKKNKFKTEKELALFLEKTIRKQNANLAFRAIVASAKNSAEVHHKPSGKLKKGFLMIDLGAKYKNYCCDMTRTIYLGTPTKTEEALYNKVLENNLIRHLSIAVK